MEVYIYLLVFFVLSFLWAKLWINTCKYEKVKNFVLHEIIFTVLSVAVSYVMSLIIFAPVDDTYSAANKGALGFIFIFWLVIFGCSSFVALIQTVEDFIEYNKNKDYDK
ncbi:MAG: hypothetical protein J6I55_01665 [Ruminococcus sp.]|jgi:hypothetical protein|nr:hypothetical protein [Ruminococcus sp.]HAE52178.1 hypothetical protein [Ruminococcus sp.]